jgi:hypothetical protein
MKVIMEAEHYYLIWLFYTSVGYYSFLLFLLQIIGKYVGLISHLQLCKLVVQGGFYKATATTADTFLSWVASFQLISYQLIFVC